MRRAHSFRQDRCHTPMRRAWVQKRRHLDPMSDIRRNAKSCPRIYFAFGNLVERNAALPVCWALRRFGQQLGGNLMGRGILLWLIGVPIPVIILLALFFH
jgi:hypothetical protein